MQELKPLSDEDTQFYRSVLYDVVKDGPISVRPGAEMLYTLRKELTSSLEEKECPEYIAVLGDMYKSVTDSLVSAVLRSTPHELINRSTGKYHIATDEEEYQFHIDDGFYDQDDEEETESESDSSNVTDAKRQKKEDQRKKRREEELLLLNEKKVIDEKGQHYCSIGPHPPPRIAVRSSTNVFLSRKALQSKTVSVEDSQSSSSDDDTDTKQLSASTSVDGERSVEHLTQFLQPLSLDSLKKISENAKVKKKPSYTHDEYISLIVRAAVKMGCEKACALMDKQKIIEDMTSHIQAGALPPNPNIDFLSNLPDHLKKSLGLVLGLSYDHPPVSDMWERMVAMGFLSVLTNLRLKPLRKIASEVSITVPSDQFTEKYCEALVFAAFPREKVRARILRARRKQVKFMVPQEKLTVKGDMGFISFQVNNISMLAREAERHYSPEFTYAGLKWSLLCMKNHESLALYLCQTGSVHCKFLITILNHSNPDDSICNEGTQSFSAVSHENDWGFNSVYKLSDLLNPAQGFYDPESDSITIEVGIVVVEPEKSDKPTKDKTPTAKSRKKKNEQAQHPEVEETYLQLLEEDAKEEEMKREMKKIKQELLKTVKEEEKTRKEIVQQSKKLFNDTMEKLKQEGKRIVKEIADREAKEEQEKQRQEEAIQQAIQKKEEVYQRLEQLRKESTKYTKEKDLLAKENKEVKKESNRLEQELKSIKGKMQSAEATVQQQKESISKAKKELEGMALESSPEPSTESDDANDDYDDDDFDGAVLISEGINKLIEEMAIEDD